MPESWRRGRSNEWRGAGASVAWDLGRTPQMRERVTIVRSPTGMPPRAPGTFRQYTEVVDGQAAEVWESDTPGKYRSVISWRAPLVLQLSGNGTTRSEADIQLQIFRTVRFTSR